MSFHIAARLHPPSSPLGQWLRRRASDRWQAEGRYIVVLTGLATAVLLAAAGAWTLLDRLSAPGTATVAATLVGVGLVVLLAAIALAGIEPRITVTCDDETLCLRQGDRHTAVPLEDVRDVEQISALRYHRHERRYAGTQCYVNHIPNPVLIVHLAGGALALGLDPDDQQTLVEHVRLARSSMSDRPARITCRDS